MIERFEDKGPNAKVAALERLFTQASNGDTVTWRDMEKAAGQKMPKLRDLAARAKARVAKRGVCVMTSGSCRLSV